MRLLAADGLSLGQPFEHHQNRRVVGLDGGLVGIELGEGGGVARGASISNGASPKTLRSRFAAPMPIVSIVPHGTCRSR